MSTLASPRNPIATTLLAGLTALVGGCAFAPAKAPLPAAALRTPLGHVAVVSFANVRQIQLQVPDSKTDIAQEEGSFEPVSPIGLRSVAPFFLLGGPEVAAGYAALALSAPVILMAAQPVAQEVRRGYGLLKADSATDISAARDALEQAIAGVRLEDNLRAQIHAELEQKTPRLMLANTDAFVPATTDGEQNYAALRSRADTILEIKVLEPNLSGGDRINPSQALNIHVRVRLLDAEGGGVLYYDYLEYRGATHRFVQWGARDAALLRAELRTCTARLAAEIVAQLFTRRRGERADPAALAATGIHHRRSAG
jgi:hypothetical protein